RLEAKRATIHGMPEPETERVQCLTRKINGPQRLRPEDVPPFADERVPAQAGLDADLVSFPRPQPHFEHRRVAELLDDAVIAHRLRALRIPRVCPFLDQRLAIPDQLIPPGSVLRRGVSVDDSKVDALGLALDELLLHR